MNEIGAKYTNFQVVKIPWVGNEEVEFLYKLAPSQCENIGKNIHLKYFTYRSMEGVSSTQVNHA